MHITKVHLSPNYRSICALKVALPGRVSGRHGSKTLQILKLLPVLVDYMYQSICTRMYGTLHVLASTYTFNIVCAWVLLE